MRHVILRLFLVLLIVAGGTTGLVYGQQPDTYTLVLRGVPMGQALEELVHLTQIDLVYTSELVSGKPVYCTGRHQSTEALLRCVLDGSGLDYVRSSAGTYVIIKAVEQPPRYGHLAGRIVDAETGEPLPYANVLLADAGAGTTTDREGFFSFAPVVSGRHRIVVTYVGYQTAVDSVRVRGGGKQRMRVVLHPSEVSLQPVIVDGLSQRLPSGTLGQGLVRPRHLGGGGGMGVADVAQGARRLSGVATQQPLADLHVQGGATGDHLTLLDGVPVRDPVSLGRHLGAFSPLAINRITVHKAGFGAEHGSYLSGVVAVEQDVAGADDHHAVISVDPVSINGKVQGRFSGPGLREGNAMLALRSSLWTAYQDPGVTSLLQHWNAVDPLLATIWVQENVHDESLQFVDRQPDVDFSDAHAAMRLQLSPFRTLHASAYRARNRIASDMMAVNALPSDSDGLLILTRDDYDWTNWAAQVRHNWLLGARSVGIVHVKGSWHTSRYTYLSLFDTIEDLSNEEQIRRTAASMRPHLPERIGSDEQNEIREVGVEAALSHSRSPQQHVDVGIELTHIDSQFQLGNQFIAPFAHEAATWKWAGYVQGEQSLGLQTILEPSLRLTYWPARNTVYAEPRLALRYDQPASRIGPYALRLAGGLYRQFVNAFELSSSGSTSVVPSVFFWLPAGQEMPPPRAYHLTAEALLTPTTAWTLRLEGYYKWQPHLLTLDYAGLLERHPGVRPWPEPLPMSQVDFIGASRGQTYGGSVRLERSGEHGSGTMTYTYSRVRRQYPGRFEGDSVPVPWNAPHRLDVDVRQHVTSALSVEVGGQGAWGRRWPFRRAYYDYLASRPVASPFGGEIFEGSASDVLAPSYRIDGGVAFEHEIGPVDVQARFFIVNVLDRQNVYDWSLERSGNHVTDVARRLPGRQSVFTLRLAY